VRHARRGEGLLVDGRGHDGIVGTPGGNAGEFILALTVVEKAGRQELDLDKVDEILKRYLEKTGKFYFHTDDHHPDPRSGITENTTESEKEKLLETLVKAESIGCGHIGLMTKNPQEYGVRPELLKAVMKSIYKTLWEKPETMEFVVLEGGHKEGAIVNILVDGEVNDDTKIPTVAPSHDDIQIFVNHPQAVKYLRDKIAEDMEYVIGGDLGGEFNLESFKKSSKAESLKAGSRVFSMEYIIDAYYKEQDRLINSSNNLALVAHFSATGDNIHTKRIPELFADTINVFPLFVLDRPGPYIDILKVKNDKKH